MFFKLKEPPKVTESDENVFWDTNEYAAFIKVKANTIRRSYCVNGEYLGVRPVKLSNGRLLWPRAESLKVVGMGG